MSSSSSFPLHFSSEVAAALAARRPLVALESTIISHGMPYPQNFHTAVMIENVIRERGAVPATIGILSGQVHIGMTEAQLHLMAKEGPAFHKTSRRDLAYVVSKKLNGATTVSGTMILAHMAGIPVFATGGIGGVHREGHVTMDVSADLTELGRTPVVVVCAGAKFILDIPRTLEYLETQGVTVVGYQTDIFPAFFVRDSDCSSPLRLDTPLDIASVAHANLRLSLGSGMVVGVPVPKQYEASRDTIVRSVDLALKEMQEKGIQGKDITPFLLKRISEISGGESLEANVNLVKNNAIVASQIAIELTRLANGEGERKAKL